MEGPEGYAISLFLVILTSIAFALGGGILVYEFIADSGVVEGLEDGLEDAETEEDGSEEGGEPERAVINRDSHPARSDGDIASLMHLIGDKDGNVSWLGFGAVSTANEEPASGGTIAGEAAEKEWPQKADRNARSSSSSSSSRAHSLPPMGLQRGP